ncbi:hypothetical protein M3C36_12595 [Dietzia cinnamea]|uniref:hypothetical protein n=1 Tax=Dietzia TaxID=37914 RepID=UPI000D089693|nr:MULTISPECIES: hypothetical protein [Dietzia]AVM66062.1 hypothetical protein C3V38_16015 [Dietzia sp. oral taxon 368]MCT1886009.1 hypothetical protein [Dietzia cinnamea]
MGTGFGPDKDEADLAAFTTAPTHVSGRTSPVRRDESADEESPAKKTPAKRSATKQATAKKAPAKKAPIPASEPPKRPKVSLPPGLYEEMHRVVNRWLVEDIERMDAYRKPLGVENTVMVTLLAFATATLKAEIEKDGGASTSFPDFIPRK